MQPKVPAAVIEAAIPFFGGIYATLLAFRLIGKKSGQDARWDAWHANYGRLFQFLGPVLILFGVFLALRGLVM